MRIMYQLISVLADVPLKDVRENCDADDHATGT